MRQSRISCQLSIYPDYLNAEMGFDYSERRLDELRGRLAVESFYGDAYQYVREKHRY